MRIGNKFSHFFQRAIPYFYFSLVARIAYYILEHTDPDSIDAADNMLKQYSDKLTKEKEKNYPFVEGVTLADENKRRGGGWQS